MTFLGPIRELSLQGLLPPQNLEGEVNAESQLRSAYLKLKPLEPELVGTLDDLLEPESGRTRARNSWGPHPKGDPTLS